MTQVTEQPGFPKPADAAPEDSNADWAPEPSLTRPEAADPLLGCLVVLTKLFERPFTASALTAGLPIPEGGMTPDLFIRAARRAGISARVVQRALVDIPEILLPAVLLMKGARALVLARFKSKGEAEVIVPETGQGGAHVSRETLKSNYTGYAIYAKPEYQFDGRVREFNRAKTGHWFWDTLAQFWPAYSRVILASVLINLFVLALPLFMLNVYDRVVPNNAIETLWVLASGVVVVVVFDFILKTLRGYFIDHAGKAADVQLSSKIFEQVQNVRLADRPASAGAFANYLREFESVRDFFTSSTITTFIDLPFALLFVAVVALIGGWIALVPALAIPLILIGGLLIHIPLSDAVQQTSREAAQKHGVLVETIGGLETIKSLVAEGRMQRKWEQFVGRTAQTSLTGRLFSSLGVNWSVVIAQLASVSVIVFGVYLIQSGGLTFGGLIASVILTGRAMAPLGSVANLLSRADHSFVALQNLNKIMQLPTDRPMGKQILHRSIQDGAVEFRKASFTYPRSNLPALANVSFAIRPKEKVGIIGRIGSGKTTIARLLMNFYELDSGSILVDGVDIRQMDPVDLRRGIGCVLQDVYLFHGTVRENISIGAPYIDDRQILQSAKIAGVDDFVSKHSLGYDMPVGERGEGVSGGQRQAIALARAILLDPPILLLDEPTSHMDALSERAFVDRIKNVIRNKTVILITHRASLLTLVDRLIVLDNGQVTADGPRQTVFDALSNRQIKAQL